MKDIKIIIAAHKKYRMPDDDIYLPLQVGAAGKEKLGYLTDDTGDNISQKNPYYCELTGIYWAYKNLDAEYIGLAHYRRHFICKKLNKKDRFSSLMTREETEQRLKNFDIILPRMRNYYIENLYDHYENTLKSGHLEKTREIIKIKCPEYLTEFDKLHIRKKAHMFNMFVMKKEIFDKYCEWLFDILFELEKQIDPSKYDAFHARYLGRVSELLLDVWINTNAYDYCEVKVADMEKVNMIKKGFAFLAAKFFKKSYKKSF